MRLTTTVEITAPARGVIEVSYTDLLGYALNVELDVMADLSEQRIGIVLTADQAKSIGQALIDYARIAARAGRDA